VTARPLLVGLGWLDAPGGLERYLADLRGGLDDPPTVVLTTATDLPAGVVAAASPSAGQLRRFRGVRRAAGHAAPGADVVDLHFALTGVAALASSPVRRLPKVVHFQGPWADEAGSARWVRRRIERLAHRGAERFIVLSGAMGRILIEGYGGDPWRVEVIPPGVDLDRFSPGDRTAARARLGLDPHAFVVVTVRRLVPRTGVHVLLDAWATAAARLPVGAQLVVASDGPQRAELDDQLRRLAPARAARLLGTISEEDLVDLYRAADVAVVPSIALEGFGLAALESLACGTPTLVTRCGGLPDAVAGLGLPLVEPDDPDALAAALLDAASGLLPSRERCRVHAESFAWPAVVTRHRAIYDDAAARRPPVGRRVVLLDHCAARSGGEIALARLVDASPTTRFHAVLFEEGPLEAMLGDAGATAEVRALGAVGDVDRSAAARPLTVARHALSTTWFTARLAWRLRRLRPDVVHANSLKAGLIGGVAARLARAPMVWHVRDRLADDYLPSRSARLVRAACRRLARSVVVPSEAVLETLGPPADGQERLVVPDPYPVGAPRPAVRPAGPLRVVMVGRLAPWKGQDVFLRAFATAFPDGDERGTVVGAALFGADEQRYADGLAALVLHLELGDRVQLLGARDDVRSLLEEADVVVHASRVPEPFGQVVVEGMAAGAAVIATTGAGPSELIRPDVDGLLVPPDDVDALASALRRLAHDEPLRRSLGEAAQRRVAERTDPDRIAALIAGVHERATRGKGNRR
jgi:glycosyltransferase involved in cell wall biosynthesis